MSDASARFRVVVVATVRRPQDLSAGIMAAFVHQVALESPTEEQRHAMLINLSQDLHLGMDVDLEKLSKLTVVLRVCKGLRYRPDTYQIPTMTDQIQTRNRPDTDQL